MERDEEQRENLLGRRFSRTLSKNFYTILAMAALIAGAAAFIALAWSVRCYTTDDAFIYLRFARNLASGHGFAFNPGERVEGVSSLLWTLLLSAGYALGLPGLTVAKVASAVCFALAVPLLLWRCCRTPWLTFGAATLVWSSGSALTWSVGGLETALHATLVFALFAFAGDERGWGKLRAVLPLSVALVVSRPEGVLFPLAVALCWGVAERRRREAWVLLGTLAAAVAALTLFRWLYFGALLPNTWAAKGVGQPLGSRAVNALYYGARTPWLWVLGVGFVGLGFVWSQRRRWLLAALFLGAQGVFVLVAGGDWMPGQRFLLPALPVLAAAVPAGLWAALASTRAGAGWARAAVAALCLGLAAAQLDYFVGQEAPELRLYDERLTVGPIDMAEWLRANAPAGASVAARDIGALGFYSGLRIVDLVGLTDPHVARTSGFHGREGLDSDYVFGQKPDFIVIDAYDTVVRTIEPLEPSAVLYRDPRFAAYRPVMSWVYPSGYGYHLYRRRAE